MAYVEWIVTSLSSVRISAGEKAAGFFYGTLYGVLGHWLKIPDTAPAIGSITLIAAPIANGLADGLYFFWDHSSNPVAGYQAKTIVSYERGGRWINIRPGATAWAAGARVVLGNSKKVARLYYRSVNDYTGPTA
jgi:fructose-1,6-bisphosphatase/inositol monophosphatase family enzyme